MIASLEAADVPDLGTAAKLTGRMTVVVTVVVLGVLVVVVIGVVVVLGVVVVVVVVVVDVVVVYQSPYTCTSHMCSAVAFSFAGSCRRRYLAVAAHGSSNTPGLLRVRAAHCLDGVAVVPTSAVKPFILSAQQSDRL